MARRIRAGRRGCLATVATVAAVAAVAAVATVATVATVTWLTAPAHADYHKPLLVNAQVTYWQADDRECAGTLITPRVIMTAGRCLRRKRPEEKFYIRAGGVLASAKAERYSLRIGPLGDIGLVLLDQPYPGAADADTAQIPSYRQEYRMLVDGNAEMTTGARLVVYANDRTLALPGSASLRLPYYVSRAHPTEDGFTPVRHLFYRSLASYRRHEPHRLAVTAQGRRNAILSRAVMRRARNLGLSDVDLDDALLLMAGLDSDRANRIAAPVGEGDLGGGIFHLDGNHREWLVGTTLGAAANVRHSLYWPWVFDVLMRNGMRHDAVALARKVLGTGEWGMLGVRGVRGVRGGGGARAAASGSELGDIYVDERADTGKVGFFRRLSNAVGGELPAHGSDNPHWEYLGTRLPDAQQATVRFFRPAVRGSAALGEIHIVSNPHTQDAEYYERRDAGAGCVDQGYPPAGTDNASWRYLGTDLAGARPMKGWPNVPHVGHGAGVEKRPRDARGLPSGGAPTRCAERQPERQPERMP